MKTLNLLIASLFLLGSTVSFAAEKYLITMPGPKPAIAKSFKAAGDGKYEFIIDSSKKIKGGKAVTFEMLKASLTKKSFITEVTGDSKKIIVSYKGPEAKFLKKVSKARIKDSKGSISLASESSVSDGSVRARTAARQPTAGEVKGKILAKLDGQLKIMVQKKGPSGIASDFPVMRPMVINSGAYKGLPGQTIFFKPTKKNGKAWDGKDFTSK